MNSSPVMVLGLDAFDPEAALGWAASGELPTLARLLGESATCTVRNPYGLLVSALWPSFATGLRPDRHGFHTWDHVDPDSYEQRLSRPGWQDLEPFWETLGRAGRRVAVVDVPHSKVERPVNGLKIVEWGNHDRHFGLHGWPPAAPAEIEAKFGPHPAFGRIAGEGDFAPDDYIHRRADHRTREEEDALLGDLLEGVGLKHRLLADIFGREPWDLFLAVFGEGHAAGHHLWHRHDSSAPHGRRNPPLDGESDPILQVYRRIDDAVGELLESVDPAATIVLLLSHGMGPHHDGNHLLEEVLGRLDRHYRGAPKVSRARQRLHRLTRPVVPWMRAAASRLSLPLGLRSAVGRAVTVPEFARPAERRRRLFFVEPNNTVWSGVRLNLAGRESMGCVDPADADSLCDRLAGDLLELVNVDTGARAVAGVERCDRHHRRSPRDVMPDLFVDWVRDAPVEAVASPKIGTVHAPYRYWRSGDHRPDGLMLVRAADVAPEARPPIQVEDIAPSLSARLGVPLDGVDGRTVAWIAGSA